MVAGGGGLIRFEGINKTFNSGGRSLEAVGEINLTVQEGEVITLVGPSGCGKSTLLNMAAGLMKPTAGVVCYRGNPVTGLNRHVGYMTQSDHLLPWRSIAKNIAVPLEIKGLSRVKTSARVAELIDLVGLTGFESAFPTQVSGGMRKRAALARLLASDPETLLMDEPFAALDAQLRIAMQTELLRVREKFGKTILFVTHDPDEAISIADRCVIFSGRPGRIVRVLDTGLPRRRDLAKLRFEPEFLTLARGLWEQLTPDMHAEACS
ncbi:MAG: transporter ATP-binding protein [Hyphomicrobiales bacterium]|nr:transporter ATP-binding protein [Hyphomicrobiales bacterium]